MKEFQNNAGVVWNAPENFSGEKVLKQHAYISVKRGKWYEEKYEGNKAVCGKGGIVNESERFIKLSQIEAEEFNSEKACKKCMKIVGVKRNENI